MSNAVRGQTVGGVPFGALGYPFMRDAAAWLAATPTALREAHARRRGESERAWADRVVLGGWPALLQAKAVVRRSLKAMRRRLGDLQDAERNARFWPRYEAETDEGLLDTLALSLGPRPGEDDARYDGRLREVYASFRARLDGLGPNGHAATPVLPAPSPADVDAGARSTDAPEPVVRDPSKMKRADVKRIRSAFWRRERRLPTRKELVEAYRNGA